MICFVSCVSDTGFCLLEDVQLVRYEFLEEIFGAGKPWPRRQEAEEMKMEDGRTALVTRDELRSLWRLHCNWTMT